MGIKILPYGQGDFECNKLKLFSMSDNGDNDFYINKVRNITALERQYITGNGFSFYFEASSPKQFWVYNFTGMPVHVQLTLRGDADSKTLQKIIYPSDDPVWKTGEVGRDYDELSFLLNFDDIPLHKDNSIAPYVVRT